MLLIISCNTKDKKPQKTPEKELDIVAMLDTVFRTEQEPITRRDAFIDSLGADSKEAQEQQAIYERNHRINEKKVRHLLDTQGWPDIDIVGPQGNRTICNVIQHSENDIRIAYLPMMRKGRC